MKERIKNLCQYLGILVSPFMIILSIFRRYPTLLRLMRGGAYWFSFCSVGKNFQLGSKTSFIGNLKKVHFENNVTVDSNVTLEVIESITVGNNVHICPNVYIQSGAPVIVEDFSCLANGVKVYASSNDYRENSQTFISMSSNAPIENQIIKKGQVHIKKNAFVGINSIILPGVTIGMNSIVGAGSLVNKDIPDNVIVFGIPAKVVKHL